MIGIITGSALVVTAVVVGLWRLVFRRPSPVLSDENLSEVAKAKNLCIVQKLTDNEREEVKAAFLAGSDWQWMVSVKPEIDHNDIEQKETHFDLYASLVH